MMPTGRNRHGSPSPPAKARSTPRCAQAGRPRSHCKGTHSAPPEVSVAGAHQLFKAEADKFVATAETSIKVHFRDRVKRLVCSAFHLTNDEFGALSQEERSERGKQLKKIAWDVCRIGGEACKSAPQFHPWVEGHRRWLGLASIDWAGKPLEHHAAAQPLRFLLAGWRILRALEAAGRGGFSLLPLRTKLVPRYITVDTRALTEMLGIGQPESTRARLAGNRERKRKLADDDPAKHERVRADKDALAEEQWESWNKVFNFEAVLRGELCGMDPSNRRRMRFGFSLQTDGYGVSLKYVLPDGFEAAVRKRKEAELRRKKAPAPTPQPLRELPTRGVWAVDQLKHLFGKDVPRIPDGASPQEIASLLDAAMEGTRCVGVDPGKLELAVATDPTRAAGSGKIRTVRYTAAQRRAETRPGKFDLKRRRAVRDEDGGEFRNKARRQAA